MFPDALAIFSTPFFLDFADAIKWANPIETTQSVQQTAAIFNNPLALIGIGIILIIATVIVLFLMKKIIINTVLGLILWGIVTFVFNANLPFLPSLVIAAIFGPAGIGAMLLLKLFGLF
ncbi:MAG: hypothetical protein WC308_00175 [archaeon]|jgi:hypothetical protein